MGKTKVKKNDTVVILAGKDKGKTGKVLRVDRDSDRVLVQGVNMVKKAMKKRRQNDRGGIMEIEAPVHISNVAVAGKDGKATRVGFRIDDGKKKRIAKKSGDVL